MTRACPDPDMTDAEWEFFVKEERCGPLEPPRLNDPPAPVKTCGGCEWFAKRRCGINGSPVFADDEACCKWEGEE